MKKKNEKISSFDITFITPIHPEKEKKMKTNNDDGDLGCGVIILAICIGVVSEPVYGWMFFGICCILSYFLKK